jgi:hypothetical protein
VDFLRADLRTRPGVSVKGSGMGDSDPVASIFVVTGENDTDRASLFGIDSHKLSEFCRIWLSRPELSRPELFERLQFKKMC